MQYNERRRCGSMNNHRFKVKVLLLSVPGFLGFLLFFLWPFTKSLWYSVIDDVFHKRFVGLSNYITVWNNRYFQLALKNTLLFSIIGVALLLILSVTLALCLSKLGKQFSFLKKAFVLPMLLPSVSVIFVWRLVFDHDVYFKWMKDGGAFLQLLPIYALYLCKNTGMNVILLTAAFTQLPLEVLESAQLDGAKGLRLYRHISLPLISPTLFFVGILSFVNSLKIFKESYLFYKTNYPPDAAYTIQFYMNNHFGKLNYQNLSCASAITAILLGLIILIAYGVQNRSMKDVY